MGWTWVGVKGGHWTPSQWGSVTSSPWVHVYVTKEYYIDSLFVLRTGCKLKERLSSSLASSSTLHSPPAVSDSPGPDHLRQPPPAMSSSSSPSFFFFPLLLCEVGFIPLQKILISMAVIRNGHPFVTDRTSTSSSPTMARVMLLFHLSSRLQWSSSSTFTAAGLVFRKTFTERG